ncbi:transcription repressor OFP13 [Humulus lupulus]|uniref:transcription repressor OFP13 n=1 Tax=Humulus lupulus TaxID=3486 RepID=UPI002B402334|nr:transcription repressor OFP13 [Humulus lupulus]
MGKKMKLPTFLFKSSSSNSSTSSGTNRGIDTQQSNKHNGNTWRQWPSCNHPKTISFRLSDDIYRTVNSVFFDSNDVASTAAAAVVETPESWFTNSSESASFSTESEEYFAGESLETVVRAARSERLFFEPGTSDTSSILEKTNSDVGSGASGCGGSGSGDVLPYKESVVMAMESDDPYGDFRRSMEEMVEIHGVKDWECLEELLGWYLRVNGKNNHGFIVGAFVDLLVDISTRGGGGDGDSGGCKDSHTTTTMTTAAATSFSSAVSCFSVNSNSNSSSSIMCCSDHIRGEIVNEIDEEEMKLSL